MKRYPFLHLIILLLLIKPTFSQQLFINELMASNQTTIQDSDGDYPDWIELYNAGEDAINLEGYSISDDIELAAKWVFPSITLLPNEFLFIFASDKNRYDTTELHTNFKIKSGGEFLLLSDNFGELVDINEPVSLGADQSYGRLPDGSTSKVLFHVSSPGVSNTNGIVCSIVSFSHDPGFYTDDIGLEMFSSFNDSIYYTLNGSEPHPDSAGTFLYDSSVLLTDRSSEPNQISMIPTTPIPSAVYHTWEPPSGSVYKANVIRAKSFRNNVQCSPEIFASYFISDDIATRYSMPLISIVTDSVNLFDFYNGIYVPGANSDTSNPHWSGNYHMHGIEWERPAHLEFFTNTGHLEFSQNFGIRIHGGNTRGAPQKSLRIYAHSEYGKSTLDYQLFPDLPFTSYKRFLLQTTFGYWISTIFRDDIIHEVAKDYTSGMATRPCIVFINGEYWGIQKIREYIDKHYIETHFDVQGDSIDLIEGCWNKTIEGSNLEYLALLDYIEQNDLAEQDNYNYVKSKIEINNYIDYMIIETYFANHDWPMGNIMWWKEHTIDAKWRWLLYDLDSGFNNPGYNMFEHATLEGGINWPNPDASTFLFRNLLKNDEFSDQFISRYFQLMEDVLHKENIIEQINHFQGLYEMEIEEHSKRWVYFSMQGWLDDLNERRDFALVRPQYVEAQMIDFFNLNQKSGLTVAGEVTIFPNPGPGLLFIKFRPVRHQSFTLRLFDASGRVVHQGFSTAGRNIYSYDFGRFKPGLYNLQLAFDNYLINKKVILSPP